MTILPRVLQEGDKGGQGGTTGRDARDPRPAAAARGPRPAALLSEAAQPVPSEPTEGGSPAANTPHRRQPMQGRLSPAPTQGGVPGPAPRPGGHDHASHCRASRQTHAAPTRGPGTRAARPQGPAQPALAQTRFLQSPPEEQSHRRRLGHSLWSHLRPLPLPRLASRPRALNPTPTPRQRNPGSEMFPLPAKCTLQTCD